MKRTPRKRGDTELCEFLRFPISGYAEACQWRMLRSSSDASDGLSEAVKLWESGRIKT